MPRFDTGNDFGYHSSVHYSTVFRSCDKAALNNLHFIASLDLLEESFSKRCRYTHASVCRGAVRHVAAVDGNAVPRQSQRKWHGRIIKA